MLIKVKCKNKTTKVSYKDIHRCNNKHQKSVKATLNIYSYCVLLFWWWCMINRYTLLSFGISCFWITAKRGQTWNGVKFNPSINVRKINICLKSGWMNLRRKMILVWLEWLIRWVTVHCIWNIKLENNKRFSKLSMFDLLLFVYSWSNVSNKFYPLYICLAAGDYENHISFLIFATAMKIQN